MKRVLTAIVLSTMVSVPAFAHIQQPTPQQRREIEKKLGELEQEMQDLHRQLGDGPRVRTRVRGPEIMRIGPGGEVFRVIGGRMKFGFGFDAAADSGVRVTTVTPGSPAERVGLKSGDIVAMFNGVKLTGQENAPEELRKQAENLEVGDTVGIEFRRGNDKKSGKMIAEDLGPNGMAYAFGGGDTTMQLQMPRMDMPRNFEFGMLPGRWTDIEMVSLNKDLGEYFGTSEGGLVVRAPKDSALALKSGDVILSIDGRKPTTPPQALRILRSYERGESFDIVVLRQKKKITLTAKVPERDARGYFYEYQTPDHESGVPGQ